MTGEPNLRVILWAGKPLTGRVLRYSAGKSERVSSCSVAESAEQYIHKKITLEN